MEALDDLQRSFFDALYTYRIPVAAASLAVAVIIAVVAWRRGWFVAARRHPRRTAVGLVAALAVGLPLIYYTVSPLFIRTELNEADPIAVIDRLVPTPRPPIATASPDPGPSATAGPSAASDPEPTAPAEEIAIEPDVFTPRVVASGTFEGTDDFHFGTGTARIIETAPGEYRLRLADFSVRNGPDLFVYLSPRPDDYARGALELGRLKATDGSFNYSLPAGTDPSDFASALIWCKQFSHLFAFATLSDA
jgi:Electron transfer DM13